MREPRTLLCFGDSNTWGFDPLGGGRYPRHVRWPGVAAAALGPDWCVLEAGLNGRTSVFEDPMGDLAGVRHLGPVLASAAPVDVVAIVLGTNDLKTRFGASAPEIADGAGVVVDRALASRAGPGGRPPAVVLVAPPPIDAGRALAARDPEAFAERAAAWRDARARSLAVAHHNERGARQRGVAFLDAGAHVRSSDVDMIHWSPEAHAALGSAVAQAVQRRTVR
jgi:lysophospholipase L1-like esterase